MAKRMQFSVVGLPHYTIWHLYEPSVDDIRHMEVSVIFFFFNKCFKIDTMQEMEQERLARESEEKERAERMKKIKEQYTDPNSQWEKDKADIQSIAMQDKTKEQPAAGEDIKVASSGSSDQVREAVAAENAGR